VRSHRVRFRRCAEARRSKLCCELADLEAVAQSWFEDGPDIAQVIARRAHRRVATRDDASVAQPAKILLRSHWFPLKCDFPKILFALTDPVEP
jgi:hypothetical protein